MTTLPLTIHRFETIAGNRIDLLREDLLPIACGGNKVRIAQHLIEDAKGRGATCLIAYGNRRSNLCRVLAMLTARERIRCIVVSPKDASGQRVETINAAIVRQMGAEIVVCDPGQSVADVIGAVLERTRQEGETPYYINGNTLGLGNEYVQMSAYASVAHALRDVERQQGWAYDRIALALGTGSTYAGLVCALREQGDERPVVGFTIARPVERCHEVLRRFFSAYEAHMGEPLSGEILNPQIEERALCGGYGCVAPELTDFLRNLAMRQAVFMDPVYVGKAYWGLTRYLAEHSIAGERILFVHTGSLPLVFDGLMASNERAKDTLS